jgi:hypothetical protein
MPVLFGNTYYFPAAVVVALLVVLLLVMLLRKQRSAKRAITETKSVPADPPAAPAPAPAAAPMPAPAPVPAAPAYAPAPPVYAPAPAPAAPSYVAQQVAQPLPAPPVQAQPEEPLAPDPGKKRRKEPKVKKSRGEVESDPVQQPQNLAPAPLQSIPPMAGVAPASDPLIQSSPLSGIIIDIIQGWGDIEDADLNRLKLFRPEKVKAAIQEFRLPKEMKSDQQVFNRFSTLQRWAAELPVGQPAAPQPAAPQPAAPQPAAPQPAAPAQTLPQPATRPPIQPISLTETFASIQAAKVSVPQHPSEPEQSWTYVPPGHDEPTPPPVAPTFAAPTPPAAPMPAASATPVVPTGPAAPPSVNAPTMPSSQGWTAVEEQIRNEPAPSEFALLQPTTAGELMRLPQEDQWKKVVHLEPAELSKVFDQTTDPQLKKAVINRLEDAGNPASLEVLRRCLDDPDPEIQYYALQAADRLLGV